MIDIQIKGVTQCQRNRSRMRPRLGAYMLLILENELLISWRVSVKWKT